MWVWTSASGKSSAVRSLTCFTVEMPESSRKAWMSPVALASAVRAAGPAPVMSVQLSVAAKPTTV